MNKMANSKFERNRSEIELILGAEEKFCRSDEKMTVLYRLHNLPYRRIEDSAEKFRDQDFVLNLAIGDEYILAQDLEEDHRSGESCYFGGFGSIVDKPENEDVAKKDLIPIPLPSAFAKDADCAECDDDGVDINNDNEDSSCKKQRLFGDCYSKYLDPWRHCQAGRDKSGPWIKDLGSKHGTFVNGIKLETGVCHALKSGDLISLGFIYEEDKPWMLEIGQYWIFKVYEVPQSEFEHRNAVASEALGISVIVDTILSNLDFSVQDLKSFRTLSKIWDEVAKRKLKSQAIVVFKMFDPEEDNPRYRPGHWSQQWFEESQKKLSALQNLGIRSISFQENNTSSTLDFFRQRLILLQNVLSAFALNNNQLKNPSAEWDFFVEKRKVASLLRNIISSPQLHQVTLDSMVLLEFCQILSNEELSPNASVRKLIFKKNPFDYAQILQLFPNTSEIELVSTDVGVKFLEKKYGLERLKVLKIFNDELVSYVENDKQSIKEQSALICGMPDSLQLVALEITGLYDSEQRVEGGSGQQLFNLLSKFKSSLQHLKLGLFLKKNSQLKFPELKMLKTFKLDFQYEPALDFPSIVSGFGSELFPRLKMLEVSFDVFAVELAEKFVKRNFGCVSGFKNTCVRKLRFVFPSEEMKEEYSQLAEENFRVFFPNCVTFDFGCNYLM